MLIRYDFGEKLDLSRFEKQVPHHIVALREVTYHIALLHYQVNVEIVSLENSTAHMNTIWISEVKRDDDGEITDTKVIIPTIDTRFKEIEFIKKIFPLDHYKTYLTSNSVSDTTETLCQIIRLVHKINGLMAFL